MSFGQRWKVGSLSVRSISSLEILSSMNCTVAFTLRNVRAFQGRRRVREERYFE